MKTSIREKLERLLERHEEIAALLADPEIINDQNQYRDYSKEYADLENIVQCYKSYKEIEELIAADQALLEDDDPDVVALAKEEIADAEERYTALEQELQLLLLPRDPNDDKNIFLEVRAGTGGDEAAIFAGDLFRMYSRYAEQQGWRVEVISQNEGDHGGFKEIISRIVGQGVYSELKFESGAHRVQRVPTTESQGRIHTSACTVAIMPEAEEIDDVDIDTSDLRIDTFRASGAGGQHVNKTDSAIRITHLTSGIVVECQDERSQHKNKARAMSLLKTKLLDVQLQQQKTEQAQTRKSLVGSGDRSERIRTYNYPQGRVTDHRINLTLYKLDEFMDGALGQVVQPLIREYQAEQLATLSGKDTV